MVSFRPSYCVSFCPSYCALPTKCASVWPFHWVESLAYGLSYSCNAALRTLYRLPVNVKIKNLRFVFLLWVELLLGGLRTFD